MNRAPLDGKPLSRLLCRLTLLAVRSPWVTVALSLLLTAASLVAVRGLEMRTGKLDLAPQDDVATRKYIDFNEEFGAMNRVIAVLHGPRAREATDALVEALLAEEDQIGDAYGKVDLSAYLEQFLWSLPEDQLRAIRQRVEDARLDLRALAEEPALATILRRMGRRGRIQDAPDPEKVQGAADLLAYVAGREELEAPDPASLLGPGDDLPTRPPLVDPSGYLMSRDRTTHLVTVRAREFGDRHAIVVPFVRCVERVAAKVAEEHQVEIDLTGLPILRVTEKKEAEGSLKSSGIFSLVGVSLLFLMVFRAASLPLLSVLCLVVSITWTLAWARLAVGHLTLVSSSFTAILIGLGIDFAIHVISRFEEAHAEVDDATEAVMQAATHAAPGILTGCLTTSAAFFSMLLTGFPAFQGLGIIAGGGLLLALLETFTLLPAVIVLRARVGRSAGRGTVPLVSTFTAVGRQLTASPGLGLVVAAVLLLVSLEPAWVLAFDTNVLSMNDPTSAPMKLQDTLMRRFGFFPVTNVLVTEDLESHAEATRRLRRIPVMGVVDSAAGLISRDTPSRRAEVERVRELLGDLPDWEPPEGTDRARRLEAIERMEGAAEDLRLLALSRADAAGALAAQNLLDALRDLAAAPEEVIAPREHRVLGDLHELLGDLRVAAEAEPRGIGSLAPHVRRRYHSPRGRFAVYVSPAVDVRKPEETQRFNEEIRRVAREVGGDVTGNVILSQHMIGLIEAGYSQTCIYAFATVVILLLLDLRRIGLALLAVLTVALAILCTRSAMYFFGLALNPANFVAIPLLMGVGVDNAVHLLHPWMSGRPPAEVVAESGRPVFLNAATSMLGFGGLLLARHPGMYSLGWAMTVGVFWSCVAAFLLIPAATTLAGIPGSRWKRLFEDALSHRYP